MKPLLVSLFVSIQAWTYVAAAPLSHEEQEVLRGAMQEYNASTIKQDFKAVADQTFDPFLDRFGGKQKFIALLTDGYRSMGAFKPLIIKQTLAIPSECSTAGSREVCAVRETTIHEQQGTRLRTDGFAIAIRSSSEKSWKFIGGNAVRKNPNLLWELLPQLPKDFQVPKYETVAVGAQ